MWFVSLSKREVERKEFLGDSTKRKHALELEKSVKSSSLGPESFLAHNWGWARYFCLVNKSDIVKWRRNVGRLDSLSVSSAWNDLRARAPLVDWNHVVRFKQCIPKHSFLLWLMVKRKLKAQDVLSQWDIGMFNIVVCFYYARCVTQPDSHSYLFFDCHYSSMVWCEFNRIAGSNLCFGDWEDIMTELRLVAKKNFFSSVVSKLVLAGTVYALSQERKCRLFKQRN
uniref:uncharacterized protein LOC122584889 n=1 Tax=Erigeron canadensis TaxID=72917 RepID=UPI001CB903AF|nr:uncharacterized protein LOC122584889 [Erigeron canadensis]